MRKSMALGFAICSTLLLILLFLAGRMLYIKFYHQSYADITDKTTQTVVTLTENQTEVQTVTDPEQLAAITELMAYGKRSGRITTSGAGYFDGLFDR